MSLYMISGSLEN